MLNFNSILLDTSDVKTIAKFYEAVFQKPADMVEEIYYGWQVGSAFFTIGEHSEVKGKSKEPPRIIFNFETTEVKEEFERISKIPGVEVIKEPYELGGGMIATLADPDGNYFQLLTPWESEK